MAPLKENNIALKKNGLIWKLSLAIAIALTTLWISAELLDLGATLNALTSLPTQTWVVLFLLGAVSWLLRGLRTWIVFEHLTLSDGLGMSFLHNTANNLLPMRLGELALPILARWLGRVDFSVGLTSLIWIRLLDLLSLMGIAVAIISLPILDFYALGLLGTLVFLTPLLLSWLVPKTQHITLPTRLHQARAQLIFEAQNGSRLHRIWRLTVLAWLTKLLAMAILLGTLADLPISAVMTTILGAELSSVLPIHGIAGAGSYQAGGVIGASASGLSPVQGLELSIQLHLYVLSLTALFGILGTLILMKRTIHDA
jgi:uncharacterized membrane protein YbhN (UPF0104 family)